MPSRLTAHLDAFRDEVRAFIAEHAPSYKVRSGIRSPENAEELAELQAFTAALFSAGYVGGDWPEAHGGHADHDVLRDLVFNEELAHAEAPAPASGSTLAARALINFGTEEQRAAHLSGIRNGRDLWCQLFSEPDAGSDLAALRTKAKLDGDAYVVTGQKVWTTNGQWADYGYLLARTDRDAPKHKGISAFIVDMKTPGISVRPLREITGTSDFNEVFFDQVRIPASNLIGELGKGWQIANSTLSHERTAVGASVVNLQDAWRRLWADLGPVPDASVRAEMLDLYAGIEALAALCSDVLAAWHNGTETPDGAPIVKLRFSELNLALCELALRALGQAGLPVEGDVGAIDDGRWQDAWLYARAYTIAGGSSEIMRNVISERGLGMPR